MPKYLRMLRNIVIVLCIILFLITIIKIKVYKSMNLIKIKLHFFFRYSESHNCSYDYQKNGRDSIEKNNPLVVRPKLPKI